MEFIAQMLAEVVVSMVLGAAIKAAADSLKSRGWTPRLAL